MNEYETDWVSYWNYIISIWVYLTTANNTAHIQFSYKWQDDYGFCVGRMRITKKSVRDRCTM